MSSTPLCVTPGNLYCRQAPTIILTAAHRESLTEPAHTTILHQASQTMFSTKPAQRPASSHRWFKKPDPPKAHPPAQTYPVINPKSVGRPLGRQNTSKTSFPHTSQRSAPSIRHKPEAPLPRTPQSVPNRSNNLSGGPAARDSKSFDGWMATFCVEPSNDIDGCCLAFWAPFVQYAKTHWRLKQVEDGRDPSNASWSTGDSCSRPCWAWFGMCSILQCDCVLTGVQRARIRATYGINGNIANDLCLSLFCRPCAMVQMDREVRAREGDMNLRTNPNAPIIANPPSQVLEMRYVSPRATASENSQNMPNGRRDFNGAASDRADPVANGAIPKKLQKQHPNSAKPKPKPEQLALEKPVSEILNKSSKPGSVHVEISQMESHLPNALKVTSSKVFGPDSNSRSRDALLQKLNSTMPEGKDEKKKKPGSPSASSSHSLAYCPPVPDNPPKETHSKLGADAYRGTGSSSDNKGKAKEIQSQWHVLAKVTNDERRTSESTVSDDGSVVVGLFKTRAWKKDATGTTDTHALSYVHDFTDCPVDKTVLDYYEIEEKRSQASQQHTLADCSLTSPTSTHYPKSPEQRALKECPENDTSKRSKLASAQPHTLADCSERKIAKKANSDNIQTHTLAEDLIETSTEAKPAGAQSHALVDCPEKDTTNIVNSARSQPHTLTDCPQKVLPKAKAAQSQYHALADCETSSNAESPGPQPHALADCAYESASSSPTEQHALADCRGDDGRQSRRTSSNPDSPTNRDTQTRQHRLASCPVSTHKQIDEETGPHIAENARNNESSDSQGTVKPSSQHTISDSMDGAESLSSLRNSIKGNQDTTAHSRKPRYHKEGENAANANASGTKRPSQAQHALTQILGGSGTKKANFQEGHVEAIKGSALSVGSELKTRADRIEDTAEKQMDKIAVGVKKRMDEVGEEVKKGTENIGQEVTKQADKIGGKEEHKSSGGGFADMLSQISPRSKAYQ